MAIQVVVCLGDVRLNLLPVHPERRIGKHVIELLVAQFIAGKGIAKLNVVGDFTFNQHIALADAKGLWINLLAVGDQGCFGV